MNTKSRSGRPRAGDLVQVRSAAEIMATLSADGTLDGLPFMPEMLHYCGKRFRLYHRAVQCVIDAASLAEHHESFVRRFVNDDVVLLDGVRCAGAYHEGCQRGCSIFWKEAWLERVDGDGEIVVAEPTAEPADGHTYRQALRTKDETDRHFCQSSQFLRATQHLTGWQRIQNCFRSVAVGNISAWRMFHQLVTWLFWKARERALGIYPRGSLTKTPTESLDLQAGELVEVKSLKEITATLDQRGRNRGLHFSADQRVYCGGQFRVRGRADKLIAEGTGEMRGLKDTVLLENVICDSAYFSFGGCSRRDLQYWREIWLKRVDPVVQSQCPAECTSHDTELNSAGHNVHSGIST